MSLLLYTSIIPDMISRLKSKFNIMSYGFRVGNPVLLERAQQKMRKRKSCVAARNDWYYKSPYEYNNFLRHFKIDTRTLD